MQLRDAKPNIFYPGHWGCFGGAIDEGEEPYNALIRELEEEIELTPKKIEKFIDVEFNFSILGLDKVRRHYFIVPIEDSDLDRITLHEGTSYKFFNGKDLLYNFKLTPYDSFAIWTHINKFRFK